MERRRIDGVEELPQFYYTDLDDLTVLRKGVSRR
jgi:hypothetical protein